LKKTIDEKSLQKLTNYSQITSRDIAKMTEKNHWNVMKDIRDEISKLEEACINPGLLFLFQENTLILANSRDLRSNAYFTLTMAGLLQLSSRYSAHTRYIFVQNFIKNHQKEKKLLENQIASVKRVHGRILPGREASVMGKYGNAIKKITRLENDIRILQKEILSLLLNDKTPNYRNG